MKLKNKSIYILPNIFTSLNLLFGFFAIIMATDYKFSISCFAIIIAGIFDVLDGKIARITNTTSQFGVEFDSLADLVSFGLAPSITVYLWALKPFGQIGWLAAFLFAICGALRLARFNVSSGSSDKDDSKYFTGLPIPAAAGVCAATILFFEKFNLQNADFKWIIIATVYLLSFLMVSNIKYKSLKGIQLLGKTKFKFLVLFILFMILFLSNIILWLYVIGISYLASGFLSHHIYWQKKRRAKELIEAEEENII